MKEILRDEPIESNGDRKGKFEIEIDEFEKNFAEYKEKRIVIYGTGRLTATLLGGLKGFNIIGLCDRNKDLIGKKVYGKTVLSREEAEKEGDLLIINAAQTYWKTIYSRIHDWNIPIYFKNGQRAILEEKSVDENNPYWDFDIDYIKGMIDKYEIISFDVFNTLIQRKYLNEIDLFSILQEKCSIEKLKDCFLFERKKAAVECGPEASLEDIYECFKNQTGLSDEECDLLKDFEYEVDKEYIIAREDLANLCNELIKKDKVIFVSDMYYSSEQIVEMLNYIGINANVEKIFVSCEIKKSKADGSLWAYITEKYKNRKILHIGDDKKGDIDIPSLFGVDTFFMMSPSEMLDNSSISNVFKEVNNTFSSVTMGLICSKIFNSPFALGKTHGIVSFKDNKTIGYCLFGPIMYLFHKWLIDKSKTAKLSDLLFFSREGYLLIEEYKKLVDILKVDAAIPHYIYISRRAIMNAAIFQKEDILEVARFPYKGKLKDFLKTRFNIDVCISSSENVNMEEYQNDEKKLWRLICFYQDEILNEAKRQRFNFLRYIEDNNIGTQYGVVDSFLYGHIQHYFGKVLNKSLNGFYFLLNKESSNECLNGQYMISCFQNDEDITGMNNEIWRYALFVESFFTAPHGMVMQIENGKPLFDAKYINQLQFGIRQDMQKGILSFFEDIELLGNINEIDFPENIAFAKKLFATFMDDGFVMSNEFKRSFFYDNAIYGSEIPIFE